MFLKGFWKPNFDLNSRQRSSAANQSTKKTTSRGKSTYEMFGSPNDTVVLRQHPNKQWATATVVLKETEDDASTDPQGDTHSEEYIIQPAKEESGTSFGRRSMDHDVEHGLHGVFVETTFERMESSASSPHVRHGLAPHPWENERIRSSGRHGNDVIIRAGRSSSPRI